jgi:hypothetical protein
VFDRGPAGNDYCLEKIGENYIKFGETNMLKLVYRLLILIAALIFGFTMYYLSAFLFSIPWPPPDNVFTIRFSPATLYKVGREALKFGLVIGGFIGIFQGFFFRHSVDGRLTGAGNQCWFLTFAAACFNYWPSISKTGVLRLVLLTPISMFLSLMVFAVVSGFFEPLLHKKLNSFRTL